MPFWGQKTCEILVGVVARDLLPFPSKIVKTLANPDSRKEVLSRPSQWGGSGTGLDWDLT